MTAALATDLQKLHARAYGQADSAAVVLRRYHAAARKLGDPATHPCCKGCTAGCSSPLRFGRLTFRTCSRMP